MSAAERDAVVTPLVSVVMPFKDAAPFLDEAAASVLAQTWPAVELVLVDDGGTDGTDAVAEQVRAGHPDRVRVVRHPGRRNRGTGPSRALGIRTAAGELTAFLDADDRWHPTHLEHQISLLRDHPEADHVCGRVWDWHSWADPVAVDTLSDLPFAPGVVVPGTRLLAAVLRHGGFATQPGGLLARTRALTTCAPHLERFPLMYEDQVVNACLQLQGTAVISGATTAWYRQHPASVSAQDQAGVADPQARWDAGRREFLDWLAARPELDPAVGDPEVLALLALAQAELASRSQARAPRGSPTIRRTAGRLRSAAVAALGARRAAQRARARRLQQVLFRFGADLHGRVLRFDDPADLVDPADLADGSYDAVVVLGAVSPEWLRSTLPQLLRALAPGGVLLLELPPHDKRHRDIAGQVFPPEAMMLWQESAGGPAGWPLVVLRAAVSALAWPV